MPGGDVQRVRSGLRRPNGDLATLTEWQTAGEKILDREPVDHRHFGDCRLNRPQHLEPEAGSVLETAAIRIGSPVLERRMELRNEVSVGGMDFDAVEAGFSRPRGGGGVRRDDRLDARLGHLLGNDRFECGLVDRMGNCRRRDRRLAADVAAGMPTAMTQLNRCLRSGAMNRIDQARKPRHKPIVVDADLATPVSAGFLRRGHLDGDEADAALRPRQIISDRVVGDIALLVRRARRHRRHDDAVGDLERADARRSEQDVHGMAHGCGRSIQPRPCITARGSRRHRGPRSRRVATSRARRR